MKSVFSSFIFFILMNLPGAICAQFLFSQFYASPLYTNPAKAGTDFLDEQQTTRFGLQYRNQQQGLYKMLNLSYDQRTDKLHGAIGFNLNTDRQYTYYKYLLNRYEFNYVLHSVLSKKHNLHLNTSVGIGFGYSAYNGHINSLPNSDIIVNNRTFPLLNTGILFYGNKFYFGAAIQNLNEPKISFLGNNTYRLASKAIFHAGHSFIFSNNWKLTPQVIVWHQYQTDYLLAGTILNYKGISVGAWYQGFTARYSNRTAIAGSLGYQYRNLKFTYSYDNPTYSSRIIKNNAHEVSLIYSLKSKKRALAKCSALY